MPAHIHSLLPWNSLLANSQITFKSSYALWEILIIANTNWVKTFKIATGLSIMCIFSKSTNYVSLATHKFWPKYYTLFVFSNIIIYVTTESQKKFRKKTFCFYLNVHTQHTFTNDYINKNIKKYLPAILLNYNALNIK
jgi:hypothetical protein